MSGAAQTARMVLRAPEARSRVPIRVPTPAVRAARAAGVRVSQPSEPAEREAAQVARRVVALPAAAAAGTALAQRLARAVPASAASLPAALGVGNSAGQPLPAALRRDMEPRFGADFSAVRVHTGEPAARASRRLNAAAFTVGSEVFFGRGRFQPASAPGRELIAHELTHTIQQGAAAQPPTLRRSPDTTVRERSTPQVQRLGVQDALDYFAEKAEWIPGFGMLALLLGFNPISLRAVPRTAANLLRALIQLLPGGALITQALDNHGIVERVAAWAEGQLSALGDIGSSIRQAIDDFLDGLSWSDIFDLGGVWERAKRIVTGPIDRIIAFGGGLVSGIIEFVKDAILRPIAALIEPTRGYPLLKAVLGFDPVTGDPVPRTAETLLGGFMTLIGQQEVWQNIQQGNAVARAWTWFQGALAGLMGFVTQIPTLFLNAFRALELVDIVLVPRAFAKIVGVFGSFAGQFLSWGLGTVISLLEIIFSVVAPGAMGYLRRAAGAIQGIFRNPIGFVMNLVRAAKAGFQRFAGNFLTHLQGGLIAWLTGSLPGIYIPRGFNLQEIVKFVLSVLGLSWANLRTKLVRAVGEPAVRAMEMGFELVVTLVRDGPAAAWEQLRESLANLRQMAIDAIIDMVVNLVVTRAVPRIVAMFIPGAGFISAIVSIYETIMTFVNQIARIVQVVRSFLDSMIAIAAGNTAAAAARVETTLAGLLTLAINFLAGFAGLGRVADRVRALIERIRAPIDRALDRVVAWIVAMARRLGRFVRQNVARVFSWVIAPRTFTAGRASHRLWLDESGRPMLASDPAPMPVHLTAWRRTAAAGPPDRRGPALALIGQLQPLAERLHAAGGAMVAARRARDEAAGERAKDAIEAAWTQAMPILRQLLTLLGGGPFDPPFRFSPFAAHVSAQPPALQREYANEFARQVRDHQVRLNAMRVREWSASRSDFVATRRPSSAPARAERAAFDAESAAARAAMERRTRQEIFDNVLASQLRRGVPEAQARTAAQATADEQLRGRHATHTADTISGGHREEISRMGLGIVNSTIGSQWGAKQARELGLLQRAIVVVDPDAQMNIELTVIHD